MSVSFVYAGIDVSKAVLAVFIKGWGYKEFENSPTGIKKLMEAVVDIPNLVLCCEASGGYEQEFLEAGLSQNLPACLVSPRRVRQWAHSQNILAKTDKIDDQVIARYAENSQIRLTRSSGSSPGAASRLIPRTSIRSRETHGLAQSCEFAKATGSEAHEPLSDPSG